MLKNLLLIGCVCFASCKHEKIEPVATAQPCTATYTADIKPLVNNKCAVTNCHGSNGLANLADYPILKARADNGNVKKYVFTIQMMPPSGATQLTDDEKTKLQCWLDNGAQQN
jgi:uncharacterized membrane protein